MSEGNRKSRRRAYLPAVEALEALRLLDAASSWLAVVPSSQDVAGPESLGVGDIPDPDAWDAALDHATVAEILTPSRSPAAADAADPSEVRQGLDQLQRYLVTAWYKGGIAPQSHEDCSQAVFMKLLQQRGREGFDSLMARVGREGIRAVFRRETPDGPDFFRAVDAVKKQTHRLKLARPLEEAREIASPSEYDRLLWREALDQAIRRTLSPREAELIHATLRGETPLEIADRWGLTPKTISNEKSRALGKLRESLLAEIEV